MRIMAAECPICTSPMRPGKHPWLSVCTECRFLQAEAPPSAPVGAVAEDLRREALEDPRKAVAQETLDLLEPIRRRAAQPPRLLDVGCGHGWFVAAAAERGWNARGIEPDADLATAAAERGLTVACASFPAGVSGEDRYDVVSFNDVLEHLDDVRGALSRAADLLTPGGVVVVSLPWSTGALYRLANALDSLGWHGPFDRLWQRRFPSPHLSYFTSPQVDALARSLGFRVSHRRHFPAVRAKGLWARVGYDSGASLPVRAVQYAGVLALVPLLRVLPRDSGTVLLTRAVDDA